MRVQQSGLKRVAVVGTSCSGKTTFAHNLSAILNIPHIELDTMHWLPDWEERPDAEFRRMVEKEVSDDRWVSDGNYSAVRDIVWGRATDIIWLNYSFPLVFSRGLKRSLKRAFTQEKLFSGNRESIRATFFSRDSILLWILKVFRRNRIKYRAFQNSPDWQHLQFWEFKRPSEAADFLSQCYDTEV